MDDWSQYHATVDPNNGSEAHRPPTHFLEAPRGSSGSHVSVATVLDGDSRHCQTGKQQSGDGGLAGPFVHAGDFTPCQTGNQQSGDKGLAGPFAHAGDFTLTGKQQSGGGGLAGPLAQNVVSDSGPAHSSSPDDDELAPVEEIMAKLGDFFYISDCYLNYLSKPKDMEIILFCREDCGDPKWVAIAPEWQCTLGFGSSSEAASEHLESKLVATKQMFIEAESVMDIKGIPSDPCPEQAMEIRYGRRDGYLDEEEKAYFDDFENRSSDVKWCTIQV
ncbi:hypothetical protein COCOBI_15-1270 [Coccomyxa sp. Obi]|nr:hypothetical protein COCOBI_15-1270 [Coccomyxa sp. Obi]